MTALQSLAETLLSEPAAGETVADKLRFHLTDTLAAMIAGAHSVEGREMAGAGGRPALFGDGLFDRLALGVAQTRLTEIDDIHMASCTTVGSIIIPTALALAAETGAEDADIAAGIRAGYDAMVQLGSAVDGARILYRGIWPTFLAAPFGAAATTAALLGLGPGKTAHALAIALTQVSGSAGGPAQGSNPRWLYAGWAASAGVRAALAAREGYTGDLTLLDGDWFETTHGIGFDRAKLAGEHGRALLDMSIKPWCTAKQACAALAGFVELLDDGIDPAEIAEIRIFVPSALRNMIAHARPGRLGRIVSIAWQCALAAFHRDELFDIERADHAHEADFSALMRKVEVFADSGLESHFPERYPARVEIELAGGAQREKMILDAPGDPGHPLDADALGLKFMRVTQTHLGQSRAELLFSNAMRGDFWAIARELKRSSRPAS